MSYILIIIGVAVATGLLMYLDSRLFDRPKKRMTYIKVIVMNIVMVLSVVYILTWLSPTSNIKDVVQMGGKPSLKIPGADVIQVPQIGEEMFTGAPPF
jgi:membrane-associated PAP2 superfamily phosphatase